MPLTPAEPLVLDTPRALARAISRVERGGPGAEQLMRQLGPRPFRAWTIGITGPPGAGKSTLIDRLIARARARALTVGIIAVDPTSPFTGGAILGDRVRMVGHSSDAGVFVRSMAARDSLGGLAAASRDATRLLDAYGFDVIILETVGVGQSELDVIKVADSVVVIAVPGLGDAVQTLKAGILEVADLFVVNMADRPGADRTAAELLAMLQLGPAHDDGWVPPIASTVATEERGIDEVWAQLERHRAHLEASGELATRRQRRIETEVLELVDRAAQARVRADVAGGGRAASLLEAARAGRLDPHSAAAAILEANLAGAESTTSSGAEPPAARPATAPMQPTRTEEERDADPAVSGHPANRRV
jgi:LAO/AO transport system kinase